MIKIEKRRTTSLLTTILVSLAAVLISVIITFILLLALGYEPFEIMARVFKSTYLELPGLINMLVVFIPLSLCAMSVLIAAKAGLWNIGVEGQFYIGAIMATWIGIYGTGVPKIVLIPLMVIAGGLVGGLLCYVCVLPKIKLNISETLTTIIMNDVIILLTRWVCYDSPLSSPTSQGGQTMGIAQSGWLPVLIPNSRVHAGLIVSIVLIVLCYLFMYKTVPGFELRLVGSNPRGAKYNGISQTKYFFIAMMLSGMMAGVAGALEVSGVVHSLQPTIASGYGLSAFSVAWIARLNIFALGIISFLFSGLFVMGDKMQMWALPYSITNVIKGLILLFILGGEFLAYYKITFVKKDKAADEPTQLEEQKEG